MTPPDLAAVERENEALRAREWWGVRFCERGRWITSAGHHSARRTAVISQQWHEYVDGNPAVVVRLAYPSKEPTP